MFAGSETPSFAPATFLGSERALLDRVLTRLYPCGKPKGRTEITVNSIFIFDSLFNGSKRP